MVKYCLTEKCTNWSEMKIGHNDPIILNGKVIA